MDSEDKRREDSQDEPGNVANPRMASAGLDQENREQVEIDPGIVGNNYQSGPFKCLSSENIAQPELAKPNEGTLTKQASPDAKQNSQTQHVQIDLLGTEFKPSNPAINRFTQGVTNTTRTAQGSSSPMNPMLTISTPLRMHDQSSANNVLETADQQQSSPEHVPQAKSLQNYLKKLSQQTSSHGLTKNDEITELNANGNQNMLQNYRTSRNVAGAADLVLETSNSSNTNLTNKSQKKIKQQKLQDIINKSLQSSRGQTDRDDHLKKAPFEETKRSLPA